MRRRRRWGDRSSQNGAAVTSADNPALPAAAADAPRPNCDASAAQVLRSIGETAYEWTLRTDRLVWSANVGDVLGIASPDAISTGQSFGARIDGANGCSRLDAITKSNQRDDGNGVFYQVQYVVRGSENDEPIWVEDTGRWFAGPDGSPARAHGIVRVITARRKRETDLTQSARFDPLTGEFNRTYLVEMIDTVLEETTRFRASCGFLLVAIDHLEQLNASYGYDVADDVIAQVTRRIRRHMRNGDHLGRFSGNKLGVILKTCTPEELDIAAERFLACIREETISTSAGAIAVTVSIGGVTGPRHARSAHDIVARSQDALAEVKARRRGTYAAYRPSVERDALRRTSARVTDEVVAALNDRRVTLAFEPVADSHSRATKFYECLLRITRADGTVAHAQDIIPIAERVGLVRMLDHRVLELAVEELAAAPDLRASVNVSAASISDQGWWDGLVALMRAHRGVAERLIVEITETAAIKDIDDMRGFVTRVKDVGCRIAIDDFGAGYTSFRNLRKLGVDLVKIDGAFVRDMVTSPDDAVFVQTLIDLARRLGLKSVPEWVPDEQTAAILANLGCDYLQGKLIGLASPERPWRAAAPGRPRAASA